MRKSILPRSIRVYGIDTSIFVRLLTGHPEADFKATAAALKTLFAREPTAELLVSNQVIGETYITLQHHYGLSKSDAREGILQFFVGGTVSPLNGPEAIDLLKEKGGAGLMDRLIIQDYHARDIPVLTNDKKMAKITGVERI